MHDIKGTFQLELSAHSLPDQAVLVKFIDQELRRYQLPRGTQIHIRAEDTTQRWETALTLEHHSTQTRERHLPDPRPSLLTPIPERGKNIFIIGMITGFCVCLIPWIRFVLSYLVIIIHELGHALTGWLMGYPSLPALDFIYGGGITLQLSERWVLIPLIIYGGLGWFGYFFRRNFLTVTTLATVALIYTFIYFTRFNQLAVIAIGHGLELIFIGIFL